MKAQFKEKTYEKQFGIEIGRLTNIVYSPDQCDEKYLGFDDAFFLPINLMSRLAPYRRFSRYDRLTGMSITDFGKLGAELSKRMPPFRFNVFAQYKRPEYLKSHAAKQWSDWNKPFYRYTITPHQQELLKEIEDASHGRAVSIYASPAFWTSDELWQHIRDGTIIDSSNIAAAGRLVGHGRYTYDTAGHYGRGHSRTEEIRGNDFRKVLALGLENSPLPFNQHIKKMAQTIVEVVQLNDRSAQLFKLASEARGHDGLEDGSLFWAVATIEIFAEAFDITPYSFG